MFSKGSKSRLYGMAVRVIESRKKAGDAKERFVWWSECRELNPVYMHPMHAYCRYTTLRYSRAGEGYDRLCA